LYRSSVSNILIPGLSLRIFYMVTHGILEITHTVC
jgi:hypothetical protein